MIIYFLLVLTMKSPFCLVLITWLSDHHIQHINLYIYFAVLGNDLLNKHNFRGVINATSGELSRFLQNAS